MPFCLTPNANIRYEIRGKGPVDVLFIPGLGNECHPRWLEMLESMGDNLRCITYEQRGVGETTYDNKPFTIQDLADDARHLINGLGLKKPHLYGSSLGACVARELVFQTPTLVDKVILANTFARLSPTSKKAFAIMRTFMAEGKTEEGFIIALPWLYSPSFLKIDGVLDRVKERFPHKPESVSGRLRQFDAVINYNGFETLQEMQNPCLVLYGSEDCLIDESDQKKMLEILGKAQKKVIPNCGHATHMERPKEFREAILDFISPQTL